MLASPTKINERIRMGLGLQQSCYDLALQAAECGGRSHLLACRAYRVDRNMRGEVHA
jgi:hypothetical protein